ncbi:putative GntR family transcriptional regulator [uncultured Alphaproteobacteria bacterium]|uniref:Putative GntR family transcriptional regulator n=1 Tax=uncultured Alphaproteobacteria bacterium TaxID=91750 RepID=A0A212K688_9PROT|nr:putative GntR family transcriptional regulator [uncultured Alphaproteobacteria bacterium]
MIGYQGIVTTSVARQIADSLRTAILDGRIKVDERLPTEEDLAARYGVSRPTIREALKRLAAQNLVRSRRGPAGGNFVVRPAPAEFAESLAGAAMLMVSMGAFDHDEIATARRELQGLCCRLAAEHRGDDHLARMAAEIAIQSDAETADTDFCASDVRFHRAIVDAAGNGLIGLVMHAVVEAMTPVTNMVIVRERSRAEIAARHRALLAAIAARDGDDAQAVLADLMTYLGDQYAAAIRRRAAAEANPGASQ